MVADFIAKLRGLNAKNSRNELSIEKFLAKNERQRRRSSRSWWVYTGALSAILPS